MSLKVKEIENLNREAIQKTIDMIKAAPAYKFRMADWFMRPITQEDLDSGYYLPEYVDRGGYISTDLGDFDPHNCKSAACLAGWAYSANSVLLGHEFDHCKISDFLGLSRSEGDYLFRGWDVGVSCIDKLPDEKRKAAGIWVLENLLTTGEIDWRTAYYGT